MYASFNRFEIQMTKAQADSASHAGQCDSDVAYLVADRRIQRQLAKIGTDAIREELKEYGAWDADELADDTQNQHRIVWCAACNIHEEAAQKRA